MTQLGDAAGTKALGTIVTTHDEKVQLHALTLMFRARQGMKPAVADVGRAATEDPSVEVRKRALHLLPVIDYESPLVEETLRRALRDPDASVHEQADSSLRYLSSRRPGGYNHR